MYTVMYKTYSTHNIVWFLENLWSSFKEWWHGLKGFGGMQTVTCRMTFILTNFSPTIKIFFVMNVHRDKNLLFSVLHQLIKTVFENTFRNWKSIHFFFLSSNEVKTGHFEVLHWLEFYGARGLIQHIKNRLLTFWPYKWGSEKTEHWNWSKVFSSKCRFVSVCSWAGGRTGEVGWHHSLLMNTSDYCHQSSVVNKSL